MVSLTDISEGKVVVSVPEHEKSQGPKRVKDEVFYNPAMQMSRDTCISFLNSISANDGCRVLDGMGATGVRGLRIFKETSISNVTINDVSSYAIDLIKKNAKKNSIRDEIKITEDSIEKHLMENRYQYDYIDIDPFGTPVPYYPLAARYVAHEGILGVTATDTAVLCGTYPDTCKRRYSARPENNWCRHENGLRILMGYCAREAARHDRWIEPLLSYYEGHHLRTYLKVGEGKSEADRVLKRLERLHFYDGRWKRVGDEEKKRSGPFWTGKLFSEQILKDLKSVGKLDEDMISLWRSESDFPPFFYDTNALSSSLKVNPPAMTSILEKLREKGFKSSKTHFSTTGIKTDASYDEMKDIFLEISS